MITDARAEFTKALGESNELFTESLKVKRNSFQQKRFDSKKFIGVNGQDTYDSYCNQIDVTQLRISTLYQLVHKLPKATAFLHKAALTYEDAQGAPVFLLGP